MSKHGSVKVGTSGWSYDHWRGKFYPEHLASQERLPFYTTHFPTVEINNTFYRTPSEHAVKVWHDEVPRDFAFAVKGSRFVTHFRKLVDARDAVNLFMDRMSALGGKMEVVLWQLPPKIDADSKLLDCFLGELPKMEVRHAVEFRDPSWLTDDTFAVLRKHNAAHVHVASNQMPRDLTVTADFVYVRFHGSDYHGAYARPALEPWTKFLREQVQAGRDGYVYFNNDAEGHAPKDAARLIGMLGEDA